MKTILLIILMSVNGADGTVHEGSMVARGDVMEDGTKVPFASMDACEAKAAKILAAAKKAPAEVRSVGVACVEVPIIPVGQEI